MVNHSFGAKLVSTNKSERANAWFVGVAPRRNPDIVVVVLWEHGGWGAGSAHLAAQVIETFVDKQRRLQHNIQAPPAEAVEVGAVYSQLGEKDAVKHPGEADPAPEIGPATGPPTGRPTAGLPPRPAKVKPATSPVARLGLPATPESMGGSHFWVPVHPGAASGVSVAGEVLVQPVRTASPSASKLTAHVAGGAMIAPSVTAARRHQTQGVEAR